jgi:hypothetical protein
VSEPPEWHGHVTDVAGDLFTVELYREGGLCGVLADYSISKCGLSGVEPGDLVVVTADSVRLVELPPWTQEKIDAITARARQRRQALGLDGC